jgi:hypothetical protein
MFKRSLVILLLVTLTGSNFAVYFVYAGFEMNKKEIADKMCENKNRPWMHCNGKCYLMKKLKQAEEKEKKHDLENQRVAFTLGLPAVPFSLSFLFPENIVNYHPLGIDQPISCTFSIFQPPKCNS